jgi:hypothetical protein
MGGRATLRFRGSEMDEALQAETEGAVRIRAAELFREQKALACGSDIILAETALELGLEFNVVLPFGTERFVEMSVRIGDPLGEAGKWEKRFYTVLSRANSLTIMEPIEPVDRDLDGYFFYGFRYAAGSALQRAAMLQTSCRLIVVSDQRQPDNIADANQVFSDWHARNRPIDLIPYTHVRPRRFGRQRAPTAFRPVIFLWEVTALSHTEHKSFEQLFKSVGADLHRVNRTHRDGRQGVCLIGESTQQVLDAGLAIVERAIREKLALRVICDFGLVLGGDLSPDKKLVPRLHAADDLPGFPLDCLLATEAFAMQAKCDLGEGVTLVPVGRAETLPSDTERQGIRNRPSRPIYRALGNSQGTIAEF